MSSKETSLKEKFRIALNSTAKVISDDFELKNKKSENIKSKDTISVEIDNLTNPSDFINYVLKLTQMLLKKNFQMI
tara:strand:- start:422 stop:649 length:228 start_codon:yes stop_codon:yes gene_type:complete